jgi:hypothetical protein
LTRFEVFAAVLYQVEVFWVVTPCNVVVGYHHFGGPCCLHLQVEVFWVVPSCSIVVGTNVSEVSAVSIFRVKIQVEVFWLVTPCSVVVG